MPQFRRSTRKRAFEVATATTAVVSLPAVPIVAEVKKQKPHECGSNSYNRSSDSSKEKRKVEAVATTTQFEIKEEYVENKEEGQQDEKQTPPPPPAATTFVAVTTRNKAVKEMPTVTTTSLATIAATAAAAAAPAPATSKHNKKVKETPTKTTTASAPAQKNTNLNNDGDGDGDDDDDIKPDLDKLEQDIRLNEQQQQSKSMAFTQTLTLTPAQSSQLSPLFLISQLTPVNGKNIVFNGSGDGGVMPVAGVIPKSFSIDPTAGLGIGGAAVGLGSVGTANLGVPGNSSINVSGVLGSTGSAVAGTTNFGVTGITKSTNPGTRNSAVPSTINFGISGSSKFGVSDNIASGVTGTTTNSGFPGNIAFDGTQEFYHFVGGTTAAVRDIKLHKKVIQPSAAVFFSQAISPGQKKSHIENQKTTPATTTNLNAVEAFEKDEIDLQESDIDEEGYSDIDFEDDAKEVIVERDDDSDLYDPEWSDKQMSPRLFFLFETPPTEVGLNWRPKSKDSIFYFDKVIGDRNEFFSLLACSANLKAVEENVTNSLACIKAISKEEMEFFFGLCLQMSTMKLPRLTEYWNEKSYYNFNGFESKLSFSRFQTILRLLNFDKLGGERTTTTTTTNESKFEIPQERPRDAALAGLQPLVNFFNQRMKEIYKNGERLVLNDPLMFWKGNVDCVRNIAEKFRENAVTMHFLTERTGLILKILLDVERKERRQCVRNSKILVQQRIRLAKELLKEQFGKGHVVFASKYYGSYALGYELGQYKTYCTGFLDSKRYGNSKELIMTKLRKNVYATKYAHPMMMGKLRLRDKYAYFYSSDCLAIYTQETKIYNSDRRPKIVKELDWQLKTERNFRECMLNYQMGLEHTSRQMKWEKQIIIYIFNLIVLNAYILYSMYSQMDRRRVVELHLEDPKDIKTYDEFRQDIVATLLKTNVDDAKAKAKKMQQEIWEQLKKKLNGREAADRKKLEKKIAQMINNSGEVDDEAHLLPTTSAAATTAPAKMLPHEPMLISKQNCLVRKKCKICSMSGFLTFAKMCCERCTGVPGLCEKPCFKIWHDQLNIKTKVGCKNT